MQFEFKRHSDSELEHFRTIHFKGIEKYVSLKKGDKLLSQNNTNDRLFLVLEGQLTGYVTTEDGRRDAVFGSEKGMFVGVRSFINSDLKSYADVIADEDSELVYIEMKDLTQVQRQNLIVDFVPVLVNELYNRQHFVQHVMKEREAALKQLMNSEKMATLGQMAAGLAHELNNAVGVLLNNAVWLSKELEYILSGENFTAFFKQGLNSGHELSSSNIRNARKALEKELKIDSKTAKILATIGVNPENITEQLKNDNLKAEVENYHLGWQIGVALHDMQIASKHAMHVVRSVKQLAVANQDRHMVDINETIAESLTLLKSIVRQVNLEQSLKQLPKTLANQGELVQIWVNLIKNACESMLQANVNEPTLSISTYATISKICVTIKDNGPGIPDKNLNEVFKPNFTTKKDGLSFGLGLGLSIVQRLVDSYKGETNVTSQEGKTEFIISIPIEQKNGKA